MLGVLEVVPILSLLGSNLVRCPLMTRMDLGDEEFGMDVDILGMFSSGCFQEFGILWSLRIGGAQFVSKVRERSKKNFENRAKAIFLRGNVNIPPKKYP